MNSPATSVSAHQAVPDRRRWLEHAGVIATLAVVHALFSANMSAPTAFYDEFAYLGYGRFFAGASTLPDFRGGAFANFGYGLLLAPAFVLAKSFPDSYRLALLLNAAMLSCSYFALYYLARNLFNLQHYPAIAASVTACFYPSFLLFSNYAISDNAFVPAFLLVAVLLLRFLERSGAARAVYLGLALGFLYTLHARSLGILVIATVIIVGAAVRRIVTGPQTVLALLSMMGVFFATKNANRSLLALGWGSTGETTITATLRPLSSLAGIQDSMIALAGQVFYLTLTTFGLWLLGVTFFICAIRRGGRSAELPAGPLPRTWVLWFVLVSVFATMAIASVYITTYGIYARPDFILLGRYNEGTMPLLVVAGCAFLFRVRSAWRPVAATCGTALVAYAAFVLLILPKVQGHDWFRGPGPRINMFGFMALLRACDTTDVIVVTVFSFICFVLASYLCARRPYLVLTLLSCFFIFSAWRELNADLLPYMRGVRVAVVDTDPLQFPTQLGPHIKRLPKSHNVSYDMAVWHPLLYPWYQLWEPERRFIGFNSSAAGRPSSDVVIAGRGWVAGASPRYMVACESMADNCLYLTSPELQKEMVGWFPTPLDGGLASPQLPSDTGRSAGDNSLVPSNFSGWNKANVTVGSEDSVQLKSPDGKWVGIIEHEVSIIAYANYRIEFEARAAEPITGPLSVDLFGDKYDNQQQNLVTSAIGPTYRTITAIWYSGTWVPARVVLRFATLSRTPIEIRRVALRRQ